MMFYRSRFAPLCAATFGLLMLVPGSGCLAQTPPAAGQTAPVSRRPDVAGGGSFNDGGGSQMALVPDASAPGGTPSFLRFTVPAPTKNIWDVQYQAPTSVEIKAGQKLILHFWVRSRTKTAFTALVEDTGPAYARAASQVVTPLEEWQEISIPFTSPAYASGKAHVGLQMGAHAGEIDVAGLRLEDADAAPVAVVLPPPVGAELLKGVGGFTLSTPTPGAAQRVPGPVAQAKNGPPGNDPAARVTVVEPTEGQAYKIQLTQKVAFPVSEGQVMSLRFWARSSTKNRVSAVYERASEPYNKPMARSIILTPEWKEYTFTVTSPAFDAGGSQVNFQLGDSKGQVEFAQIRLINYGPHPAQMPKEDARDYFGGLSQEQSWRKAASERIEKYRKGGLVVRVVDDKTGKPVSGASVQVVQKKHAFRWGVALSDYALFAQGVEGDKYRETVLHLFNYAVLENALKWRSTAPDSFDTADKMLTWCADHNIPVRGHNLLWAGFQYLPPDIQKLKNNPTAMRQATEAHVKDYVSRTKGRVVVWDVVNEAVSNTDVAQNAGRDLLADAFIWAHETDPGVPLAYNENTIFSITSDDAVGRTDKKVDDVLHFLINEKHAPVQVLGLQSHMGGSAPLVPGGLLVKNLEHWRSYGLPLEITEFDASIPDDAVQADYYDQFMTAVFAEPSVTSFVQWGFWEGAHWLSKEGGAIVRRDFTPRPAANTYEKLVFHDWWTNAKGTTSKTGNYTTRAFLGTQGITVTKGGKTVTAQADVTKNADGVTEVTVRL